MTKFLALYYSSYGHIEEMANAVASGAREAALLHRRRLVRLRVRPHSRRLEIRSR
jgi:multimeric flavodoxin WrbA